MRIYISGGPNRGRFSNGLTQQQIAKNIMKEFPSVEVVKSGQTDYVVIDDNNVDGPSATAQETGGQVITLSKFLSRLRWQGTRPAAQKKESKKKPQKQRTFRGTAPDLKPDEDEKTTERMAKLTLEPTTVDTPPNPLLQFAKYAVYIRMLVSNTMTVDQFMIAMQTLAPHMLRVLGTEDANVTQAWKEYVTQIAALSEEFNNSKSWKCVTAVEAQHSLGHLSDQIVAWLLRLPQQWKENQIANLMNFFTTHNSELVQVMIANDDKVASELALDHMLESTLAFAIMWK